MRSYRVKWIHQPLRLRFISIPDNSSSFSFFTKGEYFMFTSETKFLLQEKDMPTAWYNIQADLPKPLPPVLHPGTRQPIGPADLAPLFPMELIKQEVSTDRYIDIPEEVQEIYKLWRPSPLYRATRLEKLLDTPAKIFYKYE